MDKTSSGMESFELDPVWDINIPEPDHVLPASPSQNISWVQWIKEIEPWLIRLRSEPHPLHTETSRFVLD